MALRVGNVHQKRPLFTTPCIADFLTLVDGCDNDHEFTQLSTGIVRAGHLKVASSASVRSRVDA